MSTLHIETVRPLELLTTLLLAKHVEALRNAYLAEKTCWFLNANGLRTFLKPDGILWIECLLCRNPTLHVRPFSETRPSTQRCLKKGTTKREWLEDPTSNGLQPNSTKR